MQKGKRKEIEMKAGDEMNADKETQKNPVGVKKEAAPFKQMTASQKMKTTVRV